MPTLRILDGNARCDAPLQAYPCSPRSGYVDCARPSYGPAIRAVEVLRSAGIKRSLVDIGESRVLGDRGDSGPWHIGIADPDEPGRADTSLDVIDEAVATSGPYGFRFDAEGRFHHLFDPQRGGSAHGYKSVTVITSTATAADALSTAFNLLPLARIERALEALGEGQVRLITETGERIALNAPSH